MGRYKVCVYAICKDEEQFVAAWMDSMKEADLVVVTDTGSMDGTVEELQKLGATVYIEKVIPWRFDIARNISLGHVPEDVDICVCTDLDERLEPGWREKLEAVWQDDVCQGKYIYNWSLNEDGTPYIQFTYFKIHKRKGFRWIYPCHEVLSYTGNEPFKEVFIDGLVLNHHPDPKKSRGSYLALLKLGVEEMPEDDRMNYYLGREYMYQGNWKDCISCLKKYLSLKTATWREERGAAMRWIASSYAALNQFNQAYTWYYHAIAEVYWMRDGYVEFAKFANQLGDFATTYFMAMEALKITEKSDCYINSGEAWDATPYDLAAVGAFYLGLYEEALTYAKMAVQLAPKDARLRENLTLIEGTLKAMNDKKEQA
ncbi:MAG: glycosyl transferase family 2 [bacterium]|nr:glycosyl transferase family 2 [bacterium]